MTREEILSYLSNDHTDITDGGREICGNGLHYCDDWVGLPIDAHPPQIDSCTHYRPETGGVS